MFKNKIFRKFLNFLYLLAAVLVLVVIMNINFKAWLIKGIVKVWHKLVKCCDDFSDDEMRRHNSVDVLLTQIHQKVYNKQKPWTKE
jgi:hypothetical protein